MKKNLGDLNIKLRLEDMKKEEAKQPTFGVARIDSQHLGFSTCACKEKEYEISEATAVLTTTKESYDNIGEKIFLNCAKAASKKSKKSKKKRKCKCKPLRRRNIIIYWDGEKDEPCSH